MNELYFDHKGNLNNYNVGDYACKLILDVLANGKIVDGSLNNSHYEIVANFLTWEDTEISDTRTEKRLVSYSREVEFKQDGLVTELHFDFPGTTPYLKSTAIIKNLLTAPN